MERGNGFRVLNRNIQLSTENGTQFIDLTDQVQDVVRQFGLNDGVVVVYARHTTAGVVINEAEPLLLGDMVRLLDGFAPKNGPYQHDDFSIRTVNMEPNERANGHAHCQRLFIGASESIPIINGELQLGRWQRIFFVELDGPRPRDVLVQAMGT